MWETPVERLPGLARRSVGRQPADSQDTSPTKPSTRCCSGVAVCGSPETVRAELATQIKSIDFNDLVCQVAWGILGQAQEMHSLALFRSEVMPNLAGA